MDIELKTAAMHLRLAALALTERGSRLESARTRMSRHYNRVQHTAALIALLEELRGVIQQDPDLWDDNPDDVPF